jgi:hypothetical protein
MLASKLRRPSPALVISVLALFIALGGSAYAANQLAKNSVGTKQLKKNAVTTPKIKNNAITGAKINEGTLGAVPTATNATSATNAVNATNFSRYFTTGVIKASPGQAVTLYTSAPFTFTGHCKEVAANDYEAWTTVTTTQPNSAMGSSEDSYYEANFNPGIEAEINYSVSGTTPESNSYYPTYYGGFSADSADAKTMLSGELFSAVHYYGAACAFWGHGFNNAA